MLTGSLFIFFYQNWIGSLLQCNNHKLCLNKLPSYTISNLTKHAKAEKNEVYLSKVLLFKPNTVLYITQPKFLKI